MPDHRPEHEPQGDPCKVCGLSSMSHRAKRSRAEYFAKYKVDNSGVVGERRRSYQRSAPAKSVRRAYRKLNPADRVILGIDGEGWTDKTTGEHHYSYLCASTSTGRFWEIEGDNDLPGYESSDSFRRSIRTEAIFDFLLGLPQQSLVVGFSLGYDKTKWIENMPGISIHFLNHPELRPGKWGPRGLWWSRYRINSISTKFTLELVEKRVLEDQSASESTRRVVGSGPLPLLR